MDLLPYLPPLNAILNGLAATLAGTGYWFIRRGNRRVHRACMLAALAVSTLFMVSYLYYHARVGNIPFAGQGWIRPLYFSILASHVILAALMVPLILIAVTRALKGFHLAHRRIARWALPVWLYVSVTGVLIYLMAFHFYAVVD